MQGDSGDVFPATAAADDLDGVGLDDGHLLGPVRAAVAIDRELAVRAYRADSMCWVLGARCWDHAWLFLWEKVGVMDWR